MKALFFIVIVLLFNTILFSQNENNYPIDRVLMAELMKPLKVSPPENIEKVVFTRTSKSGEVTVFERTYDSNGRVIKSEKTNKKGELIPLFVFDYSDTLNSPSKVTIYDANGKIKAVTSYVRNASGRMTEYLKINSKNVVLAKSTWIYNDSVKIEKSIKYCKGGEKVKNAWVYDYYPNGGMAKTTLLDGKNKIKYVWSYDCNEEGTKLEKEKDLTQICNWKKTEDNFYITVYQTFDEKGKIRKYISKYAVADSSLVESQTYNENDELVYRVTYGGNYDIVFTYESFKDGVCVWKRTNTYEEDRVLLSEFTTKKGFFEKTEYLYDSNNLLTEYKRTNNANIITEKIEVKYYIKP